MRLREIKDPKKLTNEDLLYEYRAITIELEELITGIDYVQEEYDFLNKIEYSLAEEIFLRMYCGVKKDEQK